MEFTLDDLQALAEELGAKKPKSDPAVAYDDDGFRIGQEGDVETGRPHIYAGDTSKKALAHQSHDEEEEEVDISLLEEDEEITEVCGDVLHAEEEDEEDLYEDVVKELVEELVVDLSGDELTGWAGRPEVDRQYAEKIRLAKLASTEAQEELAAIKQGVEKLAEDKKNLENSNKKLKEAIYYLKNKLEEVNFSNAKLLYVNRTLNSASLNERQKKKVVGSIQNADSIDEAKVIFETLQSTMGVAKHTPKSLSEAINKSSKTIPSQKKDSSTRSGVLKERFQRLAGIK
jgi:hypothetical protein